MVCNTGNIFASRRQDKDLVDDEVSAVETSNMLQRFSGLNFYWEYKGVHKRQLAKSVEFLPDNQKVRTQCCDSIKKCIVTHAWKGMKLVCVLCVCVCVCVCVYVYTHATAMEVKDCLHCSRKLKM